MVAPSPVLKAARTLGSRLRIRLTVASWSARARQSDSYARKLARTSSSRVAEAIRTNWSCRSQPMAANSAVMAIDVENRIRHSRETEFRFNFIYEPRDILRHHRERRYSRARTCCGVG